MVEPVKKEKKTLSGKQKKALKKKKGNFFEGMKKQLADGLEINEDWARKMSK